MWPRLLLAALLGAAVVEPIMLHLAKTADEGGKLSSVIDDVVCALASAISSVAHTLAGDDKVLVAKGANHMLAEVTENLQQNLFADGDGCVKVQAGTGPHHMPGRA